MPDQTITVRMRAVDETGPATAQMESHFKQVDQAADSAAKHVKNIGPAAEEAASRSSGPLSKLSGALGDIGKMAAGFAVGNLAMQLGQGLQQQISGSIEKAQEFTGAVKSLQMITGAAPEQLSGVVAAFERFGVSTQQASTSLGIFSRQITKTPIDLEELGSGLDANGKPLKGFADVMHDLGVNTEDSTGKTRPMIDVLMQTADKFKELGKGTEATADAMVMFGRSGKAMLPLLMQGSEGIKEAADTAAKFGMQLTAENMAQVKDFGMANKDLGEAMNGLKLQLGLALMPALAALAHIGANLAQTFNQTLMPAIKELGNFVSSTIVPAIQAFANVINQLTKPLQDLVGLLTSNEQIMNVLKNVLVVITAVIGAYILATEAQAAITTVVGTVTKFWTLATEGQTIAQYALNLAMSLNPVGLIVAAIVGLIAVLVILYNNVQPVRDILNAFWEAITGDPGALGVVYDVIRQVFGDSVADFIQPFLQKLMDLLNFIHLFADNAGDLFRAFWEAITGDPGAMGVVYDIIRKVFGDSVAEFLQPFLQWFMDFIPKIHETVDEVVSALGQIWEGIQAVFGDIMSGNFAQAFSDFQQLIVSPFQDAFNAVVDLIHDFLGDLEDQGGIIGGIASIIDAHLEAFQTIWNVFLDLLQGNWGEAWDDFREGIKRIGELLGQAWSMIGPILRQLADNIGVWIGNAASAFGTQMHAWFDAFVQWAKDALAALPGELAYLIGFVLGWISVQAPKLGAVIGGWKDAFLSWAADALAALPGELGNIWTAISAWVVDTVPKIIEQLAQWYVAFGQWEIDVVTHLPENLANIVTAIKDWITGTGMPAIQEAGTSLGKTFWDAVTNFITNAMPDLKNKIGDFFSGMGTHLQTGLGAGASAAGGGDSSGAAAQLAFPDVSQATGGWLREPIRGVGPSGTKYELHANEYISPAGSLAQGAANAHAGGGGGGITLNVHPGAVQISGANGPAADWAAAADGLWDDLYAKLSRALDNRVSGVGAPA